MLRSLSLAFMPISLFAVPATADGLRDFCPDRPGLDTPTCIMDKGHVGIELGLIEWTRIKEPMVRTDEVMFSELTVRFGVTSTAEVQVAWDGYGILVADDRIGGSTTSTGGAGDMRIAIRQSLRNPDGSGLALAVMPYVSLPIGSKDFTAGDWGAGFVVPVSLDLGNGLSLAVTPEIDAAVNSSGDGRHLAFGSAAGLTQSFTQSLSASLEVQVMRDQDPAGHATEALASLSFGWKPQDNMQFDTGIVVGLTSASPDAEVYGGLSRRF